MIPEGHTIEDIKKREQIIRDFYREWKEKNPSQRKYNLSLKEYINIRMVSIVETSEHAAKSYLSTLAVLQLDSILTGARKVSVKKPKPGNANRTPIHENRRFHGRHAHKQHLRARKTLTCATNPNQPCFQVYPTDHTQDQSISTYRNHPDQRRSTCPTWQGWLPFELRWQSGP